MNKFGVALFLTNNPELKKLRKKYLVELNEELKVEKIVRIEKIAVKKIMENTAEKYKFDIPEPLNNSNKA